MMPEMIRTQGIIKLWGNLFAQKPQPKDTELMRMIEEAKDEINLCRRNYEFCDNEILTDMYIYALKTSELRYTHLLKIAKKQYEEGLI